MNALEDGQRVWHELKDSFQGGGSKEMKIYNFAFPLCFLHSKNTQAGPYVCLNMKLMA